MYKIRWYSVRNRSGKLKITHGKHENSIKASNWKKLSKISEEDKEALEKQTNDFPVTKIVSRRRLLPMERLLKEIERAERTA